MSENYDSFLQSKVASARSFGFAEVGESDLNPMLKPHQRDVALWAIRGGRRAGFAAFGLGKTFIQLEVSRVLAKLTGKRALIVLPLGVRQEFTRDAGKLGIPVQYVRNDSEAQACTCTVHLTNYERIRDGMLDPNQYETVSLDEAAILRGYGTKTFQTFLTLFDAVPYRYVFTATPAPNRYKELIHYAGFLGIMDTGQALTRFFKRDSSKAGNLQLHPHKEREFWLWMASWACFLTKPSDLGYSDEGYDLPPLKVNWHCLQEEYRATEDRDGQAVMVADVAADLRAQAALKRDTIPLRVEKLRAIIEAEPEEHFILWHDQEAERHAIKQAVPEALEVYGSLDLETREQRILDFSDGKGKYLATKPVLSGSGCNFQRHCRRAVFMGVGYKFNDFIQAIHRIYRFLQTGEVAIDIIYVAGEQPVVDALKAKWERHKALVEEMAGLIRKYGLSQESMKNEMIRTIGVERQVRRGETFTAINNDCVYETSLLEANSVDLICTSIPFGNHYEYSPSYNDFGHNEDNERFFQQMDHLTPQLLRVLKPGRIYACHVKDRILFGNVTGTGMPTVDPFHMLTTLHILRHGFVFMGMVTIETDVVRENNQTYRLSWSEQCKDGTKMGVGCPEYLLLFRKLPSDTSTAYADTPVAKTKADYTRGRWQIDARAKWNSSGNRLLTPAEIRDLPLETVGQLFSDYFTGNVYDFGQHVELANRMDDAGRLPAVFETLRVPARSRWVWWDVNRMLTLNCEQSQKNRMMHICPLQFDIVDRVIERWSNPGDTVYDPFGGIMTVPYRAVKLGRKGIGCELNPDYWRDGCGYLERAELEASSPDLFTLAGMEQEVAS
ncbi:MAG: DNA methyltransferase [Verrucomicrobiota bacterium JB024]|nr:DNA methyltransferase [Verrucomicrobiota bacterium JB024]